VPRGRQHQVEQAVLDAFRRLLRDERDGVTRPVSPETRAMVERITGQKLPPST